MAAHAGLVGTMPSYDVAEPEPSGPGVSGRLSNGCDGAPAPGAPGRAQRAERSGPGIERPLPLPAGVAFDVS
jgi:hypothetical protein